MYTHHAIHRPKTKYDNIVKVLMWALVLFFLLFFGNNIEVDPFRQRAVCKANLLIAQGIALGIVHAREDAL